MTKEEKKIKRIHRRARLHIKIVNARSRKIPSKIAWIGAACAAVCAGIWSHSYGGFVPGAAAVMFFTCLVMFQLLSRMAFCIIGIITARAYNRRQYGYDRNWHAEWDNEWDGEGDEWQSYRYHDESRQGNTYDSNEHYDGSRRYSDSSQYQQHEDHHDSTGRTNSGMSVEQAMRMFGVTPGTFSTSDLKERWREMIKKNHPDQNVDAGDSVRFEERAKQINAAYDILKGYACDA